MNVNVNYIRQKEYVSLIIGLYKNNGSVSHVASRFLFIYPLYPAITQGVLIQFARNQKQHLSLLNSRKYIIQ